MMVMGFYFMLLGGSLSFIVNRKHLLMVLMSLEFLVISFFFGIGLFLSKSMYDSYIFLFYLSYAACEGALGLGIVVSVVRGFGSDLFSSGGMLQC